MKKQTGLFSNRCHSRILCFAAKKSKPLGLISIHKGRELRFARDIARQIGINANIIAVHVQTGIPDAELKKLNAGLLELPESVKILFTLENTNTLTTTSIPVSNKANTFFERIEYKGETHIMVIETSFAQDSRLFSLKLIPSDLNRPHKKWAACVKIFAESKAAVTIHAAIVLPGVGQAIAGFFAGILVLGCLQKN